MRENTRRRSPAARLRLVSLLSVLAAVLATGVLVSSAPFQSSPNQAPVQFGGAYSGLDPRRQHLVDDWVGRFNRVSGLKMEAVDFYDTFIKFSTKTTFDAVTHALVTTPLTDQSGASMGDALDLVERVDTVAGQVQGGGSDRQFRMYAVLTEGARGVLDRSQQFKRSHDNTVYHKGYPVSYRGQGGPPSIQISIALDGRHADVDVDYRSASFPVSLFNGHLTAGNSDVRAGDNFDRHTNRWSGFQNWWRSFFGVRLEQAPADSAKDDTFVLPAKPRAGAKPIEAMAHDFLNAWLVEGNIIAAMGYVSDRAYACLAEDSDDPAAFDRGMAPVQLITLMKAAHDALGTHRSLEGLTQGMRLAMPELKLVAHPHEKQFVVYSVPDDVAARFDCGRRLAPADPKKAQRRYGTYYGSVFSVGAGRKVALLWAKDKDYWKVVSWQADIEDEADKVLPPAALPETPVVRIDADARLAQAARGFLEAWLVRKDYDKAFRYLSPESYGCYNAGRGASAPVATSPAEAGRTILAGLKRVGVETGKVQRLDSVVTAAAPVHPAVRLMEHRESGTFTLVSYPDGLGGAAGCAVAVNALRLEPDAPQTYGKVFGMNVRFLPGDGEGPVLRTVWVQDTSGWRITAYYVEYP